MTDIQSIAQRKLFEILGQLIGLRNPQSLTRKYAKDSQLLGRHSCESRNPGTRAAALAPCSGQGQALDPRFRRGDE